MEYFSAAFYMRNPLADGLKQDQLSIARNRFIGDGMQDHITIENQTLEAVSFELALEFGTDFADIFAVKEHDFALGDPLRAKPLPPLVPAHYDSDNGQLLLEDSGNGNVARTQIVLSPPGEADGSTCATGSSSSRASAGTSGSTWRRPSTARWRCRSRSSGASATSATA